MIFHNCSYDFVFQNVTVTLLPVIVTLCHSVTSYFKFTLFNFIFFFWGGNRFLYKLVQFRNLDYENLNQNFLVCLLVLTILWSWPSARPPMINVAVVKGKNLWNVNHLWWNLHLCKFVKYDFAAWEIFYKERSHKQCPDQIISPARYDWCVSSAVCFSLSYISFFRIKNIYYRAQFSQLPYSLWVWAFTSAFF